MTTRFDVLFWSFLAILFQSCQSSLPKNCKIDHLEIIKSERKLNVYQEGKCLKTYSISLGTHPTGKKQVEGDGRTPEGRYEINAKNPHSDYHKNLGVSYPNATDVTHAKKLKQAAGGDIKIHGLKNGLGFIGKIHLISDWTRGCIALTDDEIDELYATVAIGTTIKIKP